MKRLIVAMLLAVLIISTSGCAGWRHGQTEREALHRYLLVRKDLKTFGYRRLKNIEDFRPPIKGFVEYHGPPDFLYEFKTDKGRPGLRFYYVQQNLVYVFHERNWRPSSMFFVQDRPLTSSETQIYTNLIEHPYDGIVEPDCPANGSQRIRSE